MRRPAQRRTS
uniref:Uncharacterized protein n=1 Tax=Arundo donax TaxID=35708 RepID=A0A0A9C073_ARUDO